MVDTVDKSFAALIELQKQQIIKDTEKRKRDEKKADDAHKQALDDLKDLKDTIHDKAMEDTKNLEIEAKLLKEDLKSKKITQEYFQAMTEDLERRQIQIKKTEEEALKKRKEDIAKAIETQEQTLAQRTYIVEQQSKLSKEQKDLKTKKDALGIAREKAIAKGLTPEDDARVKEGEIAVRKAEFDLRVQNLEGTKLIAANLEELGNDLKDKGLDPEKNKAYQKESLKLQRAELRERLKNAESRSERKEIRKEQFAKDKRALSFSQKQMVLLGKISSKFSDMIPSQEGIATGFMGFLKKAALIGLLFMLPKILNSDTAKEFVKYMETDGIPAIKNFFTGMLKFFKGIKEGGFGFLLEETGQNLKDVFDPDKETSFMQKLLAGTTLLLGLKAFGILRAITGFMGAMTFTKGLFGSMMNKLLGVPDTSTTTTTTTPKPGKPFGDRKKLTRFEKKQLGKQGLAVNKAGQITDKSGKKLDMRKKANKTKLDAAMKKFPNYGKVAKIAGKMGPIGKILTGAFLVNELLSGKSPAELAPQIGGLFGGLAMAGLGGTAGAAIGTMIFPGIGTVGGGILGGILGGLGGDMIGTALTEYMLGLPITGFIGKTGRFYRRFFPKKDDAEQGGAQVSPSSVSGLDDMGGGGSNYVQPSDLKTTPKQDASSLSPPLTAANMFPAENATIQNIVDNSRNTSNNNYQQGTQNVTRMSSYGMTGSVINSI